MSCPSRQSHEPPDYAPIGRGPPQCPRKAFSFLRGSPEPQLHEYEIVVAERAVRRRLTYLVDLTLQKPAVISVDDLQATCDALTHGRKRGQREPHLVIGTETPSPLDKARLAFAGYALGQANRHRPSFGVVVPFTGTPKRVKLDPLYSGISKAVERLREWIRQLPPEPLACVVGKQCQTCEFRDHCRAEAGKTDNGVVQDYFARLAAMRGREVEPRELLPPLAAHGIFKCAYPVTDTGIYLALSEADASTDVGRVAEVEVLCDGPNMGSAGGPTLQSLGRGGADKVRRIAQDLAPHPCPLPTTLAKCSNDRS